MGILSSSFDDVIKEKSKNSEIHELATNPVAYPTTFLPLDFANGSIVETTVPEKNKRFRYTTLGMGDGSIVMLVGTSGVAKTTLAIQMAASIVAPFRDSIILHEDAERATEYPRIQALTGWDSNTVKNRYKLRKNGVDTSSVLQRIMWHCDNKIKLAAECPDKVKYFTGVIDIDGSPLYKLIPTVVILDSLRVLNKTDDKLNTDLDSNMGAAHRAKLNSDLFTKIGPILKASNTILIVINHVNDDVQTGFIPKAAQMNYLGQGKKIPGGDLPRYLTNTLIECVSTASDKFKPDKDFYIHGFQVRAKFIKSRSNRAGQEVRLVYNQNYGFDRILTSFNFLEDNDRIRKSGNSFYIDGYDSVKFYKRDFVGKFMENEHLRRVMKEHVVDVGMQFIPEPTANNNNIAFMNSFNNFSY